MNGLFGNYNMLMQGQGGQLPQANGVYGNTMLQTRVPQQDISAYFNKPMISQQQYGDWLKENRPLRFMMDFAIPAIQGDEKKYQYFANKSGNTTS